MQNRHNGDNILQVSAVVDTKVEFTEVKGGEVNINSLAASTILPSQNAAQFIIHIADIHIGSGLRSKEYRCVFDQLVSFIEKFEHKKDTIVVIAGDIFHHKIKYSGDDVDDFEYLLNNLERIKIFTVIVPGNHDTNLNDKSSIDLISPLLNNRNFVHYQNNSDAFSVSGVKFRHISVTDSCTAADINSLQNISEEVLLYHGPVDGAIFGTYTESNTRISAKILAGFKLAILGDIHQHQFILPTAAYSGSLIQQNLGEDNNKGFILWNVNTRKGEFIRINNEKGFIRLDLRGKNIDECRKLLETAPKQLLKVSVIADESSDMLIDIVRKHCGKIDRVTTISNATGIINPTDDLVENLTSHLINKVPADILQDAIKIYSSKITSYECSKWSINKMSFDYMFKFGSGNVIDFRKLGDIAGVIAENRAGKSSIIDILVFGLYNEHLRADNRSMIRSGSKKSYLRIDFVVNGIEYYIERQNDSVKNHKHGLYHYSAKCWINITGESLVTTYKKMNQLIGGVNKLLTTGLYYDPTIDLFRINKADRMRLLPELFGMVDNEALVKEMKLKAKTISDKISKLIKPRYDPTEEIAKYNTDIKEKLRDEINLQITNSEEIVTTLSNFCSNLRDKEIILSQINTVDILINANKLKLESLPITSDVKFAEIVNIYNIDQLEKIAAGQIEDISELEKEIIINEHKICKSDVKISDVHAQYEKVMSDISTVEKQLFDVTSKLQNTKTSDVDVSQISKQIAQINQELPTIKQKHINTDYIDSLQKRLQKLKENSLLRFAIECKDCQNNKQCLSADLAACEAEVEKVSNDMYTVSAENELLQKRENILLAARDELNIILYDITAKLDLENQQSRLQRTLDELNKHIVALSKTISSYNAQETDRNSLEDLKIRLSNSISIRNARSQLTAHHNYQSYLVCSQRKMLELDISTQTAKLVELYKEKQTVDDSQNKILALANEKSKLSELRIKYNLLVTEISRSTTLLEGHIRERDIMILYNNEFPPLDREYKIYKTLADSLSSGEVKLSMLRKNVEKLILYANEILSSVTDFIIVPNISESTIDFSIKEIGSDVVLNSQLASGFQKFICSLAIRVAITAIAPSSCNFIIIDEGFGCLDSTNLNKLIEVLPAITASFAFAFIISHVPELNTILRRPLSIISRIDPDLKVACSWITNVVSTSTPPELIKVTPSNETKQHVDAGPPTIKLSKDEMVCTCGAVIKIKSRYAHEKTSKHINKKANTKK